MRCIFFALGFLLLFASLAWGGHHPVHVVQPGDTLYDISLVYNISWQELADLNKIKDPAKLQIGTVLRLPSHVTPKIIRWDGSVYEVSAEERDLLARLVYAEARGEPLEGQVAVAAVVLNRVRHPSFPDTVWDVIHEPGQFSPVAQGLPQKGNASCEQAVIRALNGEDPTGGALHFYNPTISKAMEYWATKPVIKRIGNHNFTL
jgi:N-acetylmuramoyl-L-alanine amidase